MILRRLIGLLLPSLADEILVNGRATIAAYPGLTRAAARLTVYYPMIDDATFQDAPIRQSPARNVRIGMVANINPDKGIDVFVEAAGLLSARRDVSFILVGEEHNTHREYAQHCYDRVRALGLQSRFQFAGGRTEVAQYMRRMDLFVISSNREGSTTTAIEAMASGLPVVATNVGAVGEVVADGQTGLLVEPKNPIALANALQVLVDDEQLRGRLAIQGRKRFENEFALPDALSGRAYVYRRALARQHARGAEAGLQHE